MQNVSLQNQLQSHKISLSCTIYLLVHNTVEIRVKKKWSGAQYAKVLFYMKNIRIV